MRQEMKYSIISHIINIGQERKSLIYDFDKVLPENRKRYDEIQAELTHIEERYISSEWIDAKDRLPEKDGRYLVVECHLYTWIGVSAMRQGKFDMSITHWMPLPDLPK